MLDGILRETHNTLPTKMLALANTVMYRLVELVNMVSSTQKWPIQSIEIPDTWSSSSGKLVLLGDAAHAMLPNMALGESVGITIFT